MISFILSKDLLYNSKARSGILYHKIKNTKPKKVQSELSEDDLKDFLKHCVVSNDRTKLKEKFQETVALRRLLLQTNGDDFRDFFKFYFVDPSLVRFKTTDLYRGNLMFVVFFVDFIRLCRNVQDC